MDAQTLTAALAHTLHSLASLPALAGLAAGFLLGTAHFGSLWWNAAWFAEGRPLPALLLQLGRLALLAGGFVLLARFGALPLLAGTAGLLCARKLVLHRARRLS